MVRKFSCERRTQKVTDPGKKILGTHLFSLISKISFVGGHPKGLPGFPKSLPGFPKSLPSFPKSLPYFLKDLAGFPKSLPGFPKSLLGFLNDYPVS